MSVFRLKERRWQLTGLAMALAAAGMFHSSQAFGETICEAPTKLNGTYFSMGGNDTSQTCTYTFTGNPALVLDGGALPERLEIAGSLPLEEITAINKGSLLFSDTGILKRFTSSVTLANQGVIRGGTTGPAIKTDSGSTITTLTNEATGKIEGRIEGAIVTLTNKKGATIRAEGFSAESPRAVIDILGYKTDSDKDGSTTVTNAGVIASRLNDNDEYTDNSYGLTVRDNGVATIINEKTGVIGGHDAGLQIGVADEQAEAEITNAGTIEGDVFGVAVRGDGVVFSLTNREDGTIRGEQAGVFNEGGRIETLANDGTIEGAVYQVADRTITTLTNKGTIKAATGGELAGFAIFNAGTIGTLTNDATGTLEGNVLVGTVTDGFITNKGVIDGTVTLGTVALNIEGDSARITGAVTGTDTVNVKGSFTTENTFEVDVFNIATGGTLTLAHKITTGPNSFHNDGTMIVAVGTQNIVGNFTTTGTFSPSIVDMDNYGKLVVDGDIALGGTLKANNGVTVQGLSEGTLTDIITYTGSRTGEFASVLGANDVFEWSAEYDDAGKRVNLVLEQTLPGFYESVSTAGFVPAYQAGLALDTIALTDRTNPVVLSFVNVPQAQVADAVVQTLPLLTGNSQLAAMNALNDIDDAVKARLDFNRGELTDGAMFTDRKVWIRPFGSWVDQKNRGDYYGYSGSTGGLVVGADANVATGLQMGLAFGYAQASIKGNTPIQSNSYDLDTYQVLGYGRYELGQGTELEFQAGVGMNKNKGTRQISYAGSTAKSSYDSTTATAGLGLRHQLKINSSTTFTPEVRADYGWISDDGYTETGAQSLNLIVKGRDHDQLMLSAGGHVSYEVQKGLALRAGLALGYDALSSQARITSAYSGAPQTTFVTDGIDPSPWQLMGSLALVGELANGMQVSATYGASYRQDFLNQNVSLNLRIGF